MILRSVLEFEGICNECANAAASAADSAAEEENFGEEEDCGGIGFGGDSGIRTAMEEELLPTLWRRLRNYRQFSAAERPRRVDHAKNPPPGRIETSRRLSRRYKAATDDDDGNAPPETLYDDDDDDDDFEGRASGSGRRRHRAVAVGYDDHDDRDDDNDNQDEK